MHGATIARERDPGEQKDMRPASGAPRFRWRVIVGHVHGPPTCMYDRGMPSPAPQPRFAPFAWMWVVALGAACGSADKAGAETGAALFSAQGCVTCHGAQGEGSALAPTLRGAKSRWKRDDLIEYLKDPQRYAAQDPRLASQGGNYSLAMPTYGMLAPADLEQLAEFVLAQP